MALGQFVSNDTFIEHQINKLVFINIDNDQVNRCPIEKFRTKDLDNWRASGYAEVQTEYAFEYYDDGDLDWLHRKVDELMKDLEELPLFKGLIEKGLKEGREQAREEQLTMLRSILVGIVEARTPELRELAQQQAALIEKPPILHALTLNVAKSQTSEEVQHYLLNWKKPSRKKKS